MSKVSTRHMRMLSMIPRSPRKITVADLRRHLESEQIVITQRTIQRDLLELAEQLPLISDEGKASDGVGRRMRPSRGCRGSARNQRSPTNCWPGSHPR